MCSYYDTMRRTCHDGVARGCIRKVLHRVSLRTGSDYLRSLNDGRQVFVDGERVKDVTAHPAFREAARSVARLYDIAAAPELRERMTFVSPRTGEPVLRAYQIPRSHADLRARRLFSETWAEATFGLMGRTPDHVAGFFCGYAATPSVLAAGGRKFADNVVAFYEQHARRPSLRSYAIVPPQIDRSKPAHKQSDPTLYAGVVKERDDGIVIAGAQQLATGGAISDLIHLSCIHPLQPGDENYANCLVVPVNAPGLKLYPAPAVRARRDQFVRLSAVEPLRRDRQLRDLRQRVRAVGARVHLPQPRGLARPVVEDAVAPLRQPSGAGALRHQAALHGRPRPAHERDDRQCRQSRRADRDGRARRSGLGLRDHAAGARDQRADRQGRRAVAVADGALFGDGAAIRAQRPHARDHPRAGGLRDDHAAVLAARFRESGDRRR